MAAMTAGASAASPSALYRKGVRLYEKGLYERASQVLGQVSPATALSDGYSIMCAEQLATTGYDLAVEEYERVWGETALSPQINFLYAQNLFDEGRYDEALYRYGMVPRKALSYRQCTEMLFKTAYSRSGIEDYEGAAPLYDEVISRRKSPFTAPSWYAKGYIQYRDGDFGGAFDSFEQAGEDERFAAQAAYYMLECRFLQKNYDYVTANAQKIYSSAPAERRQHLARIISEAYLVKGDAASAERYYSEAVSSAANMTRADYFYAGSLQYALGHYKDAVTNFEAMRERNEFKARLLYDFLDASDLFKGTVEPKDRSIMNVPFVTGDAEMDKKFIAQATAAGLANIKGHRSVGGMRASIYNAMPYEGVAALVDLMGEFERKEGAVS